jgi:hypothetical protein
MSDPRSDHDLHFATASDQAWMVNAAAALGTSLIGGAHPSAESLAGRTAVDSRYLAGVWNDSERLRAYSLIYVLSARAVASIETGVIRSGRDISIGDLVGEPGSGAGFYVAMLAAVPGWHTHALRLASWHLQTLLRLHPHGHSLFARAATDEGRRLIRALGMAPPAPPSEICSGTTLELRSYAEHLSADELPDRRRLIALYRSVRGAVR